MGTEGPEFSVLTDAREGWSIQSRERRRRIAGDSDKHKRRAADGASRSGATGLRRAGEGFDAAHGNRARACRCWRGMLRKKWIARETAATERDARRTERFAVLVPDTRLPALTKLQQAILAELAANGGELPLAGFAAPRICRLPRCKRWCGANWCASTSGRRRFVLAELRRPSRPAYPQRIAD